MGSNLGWFHLLATNEFLKHLFKSSLLANHIPDMPDGREGIFQHCLVVPVQISASQ